MSTQSVRENRLAHETSPYLLQHRHNPVDWWPWGPEALTEAKRSNRPILLSVGYAACHWCHVMAHESFEDDQTAAVMNRLFVNIKVDREERPDIDQIYMAALHHLGEQGGWPLTMFLTPDGEPVWGGTYFPKQPQFGRPAFVDVLDEVARLFRDEPERIDQNRRALMERLAEKARPEGRVTLGLAELDRAARSIAGAIDTANGGLRGAPKFPQCSMLELLWRAGRRATAGHSTPAVILRREGEARASKETAGPSPAPSFEGGLRPPPQDDASLFFRLVELSLARMCEGGIYDHLGGGFSRYSVDPRWLVPHFEKMLYDNAQLLELLALAHARTGTDLFARRARETVGWLRREMTTAEGAFSASLDADSEGHEGKFYVWSLAEIEAALGPADAAFFAQHYDVAAKGNFEEHNILNRLNGLDMLRQGLEGVPDMAAMLQAGRSIADEDRLAALRDKLLAVRASRVRPGLDDKVLADWNGLMIAALVHASLLLHEPAWIALARRAFDFIAGTMTRGDRLGHSWRDGRLLFPGLASDFAAMIRAALALHEATGERALLDQAVAWQRALDRHYARPDGGYYLTADDAEGLVVRPDSTVDDAIPNPNGLIAQNLVRLAVLAGDESRRVAADRLFDALLPGAAADMFGHLSLLNAIDLRVSGAEIVVTGEEPQATALLAAARALPYIDRIVLHAPSAEALPSAHPAREKIVSAPDAAFVCVGTRCSLPITDPQHLAAAAFGAV